MMSQAVIVGAVRTAVGKRNGALKNVHPTDLAAETLRELLRRTHVRPEQVEDVILGCVTQVGDQGANIARQAALAAGFPLDTPGVSVNRMCGSGQQAVNFAAASVAAGYYDVLIAGGVESMTRVPITSDQLPEQVPKSITDRHQIIPQGLSAEMIADKWKISREELDRFSLESQKRALRAIDEKRFEREIHPLTVTQDNGQQLLFGTDEHPRRDTSLEKLASLKPAFKPNGKVTAGNSSGINDGAAALLVTTDKKAKELGLPVRAKVTAMSLAGVDPTIMLTGPIPATQKLLKKTGLKADDVDLWECNEAFASVPLAWMKETHVAHDRMNVNGGAIALGHPLGASGARLMTTLLHEMERTKKDRGIVTMCIGFGQGIATLIERP
jgi:acetyl-CoA acyltransferase